MPVGTDPSAAAIRDWDWRLAVLGDAVPEIPAPTRVQGESAGALRTGR